MKTIIMAAGLGSRLRDLSHNLPKCMISAGNTTLIRRIVALLKERKINDITIITGYKADAIKTELGNMAKYIHNPFYKVTNSIASLWLAREELCDDVLLMNADLYFEPSVLDTLLREIRPVVMLSDSTRIETADYRFGFDGNRIIRTGKELSNEETDGEYVGLVRIDRCFINDFKNRLNAMIERELFNNWWEEVIYSFIEEGKEINHKNIAGHFWTEVDNLTDYNRLQAWVERRHYQKYLNHN